MRRASLGVGGEKVGAFRFILLRSSLEETWGFISHPVQDAPRPQRVSPPSGPRKSELRRGRFVDKNRDSKPTVVIRNGANKERQSSSNLKRSDSLTKREKQTANARRKEEGELAKRRNKKESEEEEDLVDLERLAWNATGTAAKILKTLANQRKIKRRHTVRSHDLFNFFVPNFMIRVQVN